MLVVVSVMSLAAWLWLLLFRGFFWRADQRLGPSVQPPATWPATWPAVCAVVPARNEAALLGRTVGALLAQDYPGHFSVVVVDDHSGDGTADVARRAAAQAGAGDRLTVVAGAPLEAGWTGKLWALSQGIERAAAAHPAPDYVWLSDADIEHQPTVLRRLVARAEADGLDLVSLMAHLYCKGPWDRLLIPAFVFFFQKLHPFPWVNDPGRPEAGAAGGCMLVRRRALERAGGVQAVRGELIDDCALARLLKAAGPIWLGLATESRSIRPYGGLGGIWDMVARSAYTQLGHSPLALAGTVAGMALVYLTPPLVVLWSAVTGGAAVSGGAALAALAAWALMAMAYIPTLRLYRRPAAVALLLPAAAFLYTLMTVDSALRHRRGAGGRWKGRRAPRA